MRIKSEIRLMSFVFLAVVCGQYSAAQQKKPDIVILATGGTIAGAAATGTQAAYTSGAVTIDAMLGAVPGIRDLANIKGRADLQRRVAGHDHGHHAHRRQAL